MSQITLNPNEISPSESIASITASKNTPKIACLNWTIIFMLMGFGMALGLFYYGINVPYALRLRGDAYQYMTIALQFKSLGDALHYTGTRTLGFPLFDYLFVYWDRDSDTLSRMNHICIALFMIHEITSLWICVICAKLKLVKKGSIYFSLLFVLLAAYPAIVMHTTTPLTDVFGMDILLLAFSLFAWTQDDETHYSTYRLICIGIISGVFLGYAILVRPAYSVGVLGFLVMFMLVSIVNYFLYAQSSNRKSLVMGIAVIFSLMTVVLPITLHCKEKYNGFCLQDQKTFSLLESVNAGLIGTQTIWNYMPTALPVFPDPFMARNFHDRCHVRSLIGGFSLDESSLLGCFYHAPGLALVFVVKKMMGLFNTFRMTPYTELITPVWYLWISGVLSGVAFVGFWILLMDGVKRAGQLVMNRKPLPPLLSATWVFCIMQASMHVLLHVEERYAFPWVPFCLMALLFKIKNSQKKNYSSISRWLWLLFGLVTVLIYFIQILIWDRNL